jgi:hypothetical protein
MGKEFDDAFEQAIEADNNPPAVPTVAEESAATEASAVQAITDEAAGKVETPAAEPAAAAATEVPAETTEVSEAPAATETAAAPAAVVEPPAAPDQVAVLQAELAALRAEITKSKEAPPEPPVKAVEPPAPVTADTLFNADEKKILADYEEDWPEVSKAEALKRKLEIAQMEENIYKQIGPVIGKLLAQIQPLAQTQEEAQADRHINAIKEVHKDWGDKLIADCRAWVETQPSYIKRAAQEVLESGTAQDVITLFTDFKTQTGRTQPQEQTPPEPVVTNPNVTALKPVTAGVKQAVPKTDDPNDFEGAWKKAAGE